MGHNFPQLKINVDCKYFFLELFLGQQKKWGGGEGGGDGTGVESTHEKGGIGKMWDCSEKGLTLTNPI